MSEEKEKKTVMTPKTRLTIQIVGAGIFGALSAIAFPILKPLIDATRVPQGLALFDPISIIWMGCFLIFGPLAVLAGAEGRGGPHRRGGSAAHLLGPLLPGGLRSWLRGGFDRRWSDLGSSAGSLLLQ